MSAAKPRYIVVERAGYIGEQDVGAFGSLMGARAYLDRAYTPAERDPESDRCLFPDICVEIDGQRSYELL